MPRHTRSSQKAALLSHIAKVGYTETLAQIAARFQVPTHVVHRLRAEHFSGLSERGDPPKLTPQTGSDLLDSAPPLDITTASKNPREFIQRVLSGTSSLTVDQQRAALSEIILHSANEANKVAAQNALTRLDAQAGHAIHYGPGDPLTDEAKASRLSALIAACGLPITRAAIKLAFPNAKSLHNALAQGYARSATDEPDPVAEASGSTGGDAHDPNA